MCLDDSFITHQHIAGKYHHSSLSKGKKVKCAGLWIVEDGVVQLINNSSGHFKPSSLNFYKLIRYLMEKKVVNEKTRIGDLLIPEEYLNPEYPSVINKGKYLLLPEYLAFVETEIKEIRDYIALEQQHSYKRAVSSSR